jgi:hypothetical protein
MLCSGLWESAVIFPDPIAVAASPLSPKFGLRSSDGGIRRLFWIFLSRFKIVHTSLSKQLKNKIAGKIVR